MMLTITLGWWIIPSVITVASCGYALCIYDDGGGPFSGIGNLMLLVPALAVSLVAWIIAAALK